MHGSSSWLLLFAHLWGVQPLVSVIETGVYDLMESAATPCDLRHYLQNVLDVEYTVLPLSLLLLFRVSD